LVALALQKAQLALQQATVNKAAKGSQGPNVASATSLPSGATTNAAPADCKIYVGSIYYDITEENIRSLFSPFGTIKKIDMSAGAVGKNKGYCFIEYSNSAAAHASIAMDGFEISGRKIKVGWPTMSNNAQSSASSSSSLSSIPNLSNPVSSSSSLSSSAAAPLPSMIAATMLMQALGEKLPDTNKVIVRNIHTAISIEDLQNIFSVFGEMSTCAFIADDKPVSGIGGPTKSAIIVFSTVATAHDVCMQMNSFSLAGLNICVTPTQNEPSSPKTTLVLENMVLVEELDDPELKDEIIEEASCFGTLTDITITVLSSQQVQIHLTYASEEMARLAMSKMDKRSFAKRIIKAYLK